MKDFLKFTLATVAGIVVSLVVLFFLSVLIVSNAISSSSAPASISKNSVLMLDFNGTLVERAQNDPLQTLSCGEYQVYGLEDVLNAIRNAKENENIQGIYLQPNMLEASFASLEEIRDALADFKESGKFVIAYADLYSQGAYYLSSVADRVLLNPQGSIQWSGLVAQPVFFKKLLEKVGVEMQVFKVGTYKSAVEPYIATEMSDANREQIEVFLGSIWGKITEEVGASRNLSVEQLNTLADRMMLMAPAEEVVGSGLADTLMYKNDIRDYLKARMGIDKEERLNLVSLNDMTSIGSNKPKDKSGNIVAIYYAEGEIVNDNYNPLASESVIDASQVITDLRSLAEDDDVKAVVLRINSPGGSSYASEQIWKAVSDLKAQKPVIVSMGDYAASGGYYIACNADTIVAQPTTLTGSIGIFGMLPNAAGLADKVGLDFDVVKTNTYADMYDVTRPMNESEKLLMQQQVNRGYDTFLTRCSDGRGIAKEELDKIAQGRVWTGSTALQLGLVDVLGGLDTALEIAVSKAGIDSYTLMSYPAPKSFLELLMEGNTGSYIRTALMGKTASKVYQQLRMLEHVEQCDRLQARIPFDIHIR